MSQNLVDLTSRAFSDSLAARTATPGGGSLAGAGSVALNWIRNRVEAKIANIGDIH